MYEQTELVIAEIGQAIKNIIDIGTEENKYDSKRFLSLLDDLVPDLANERRIFRRVITDEVLRRLVNISTCNGENALSELMREKKRLEDELGLRDIWSSLVINSFGNALSVKNDFEKNMPNQSANAVLQNVESCRLHGSVFSKHKAGYRMNRPMVLCGWVCTVGLKKDGTVVAVGNNEHGQCDVSDWQDVVAISCGHSHTVGLKKDGTVVGAGFNEYGQCNISSWYDITATLCGNFHTVGLKEDGTVVAVGSNRYGESNVSEWRNIVAVLCGCGHTVGLKKDGTVVAVGHNGYGQCDVSKWKLF